MIKKIIMNSIAVLCFGLIAIVIIFAAHEGLVAYTYDFDPNYALIDRCLDLGGQWDYNNEICKE